MPKISDRRRRAANTLPVAAPAAAEAEHFYTCPICAQAVDGRNLGDVIHHEQAEHDQLPPSAEPEILSFIEPLIPVLAEEPPEGDDWLHEIKYDGYRTQIHIHEGRVRAYTRNAHDWTERYHPLVGAAAVLPCASAILDGEVIVQDEQGRSDFHALRSAIAKRPHDLVFMAFDLLHLDGRDLRREPVEVRREILQRLIGEADPTQPIHYSDHLIGGGKEMFVRAEEMGLEGIVSKRLGSRYRSGPSRNWLKTKTFAEEEFVVIGTSTGNRAPVALLAREEAGRLSYAGGAMVTLKQPERDRFWKNAERLRSERPPIPMKPRKDTGWTQPQMRVCVKTLRGEEMLRHATITRLLDSPEKDRAKPAGKARAKPSSEPHLPSPRINRDELNAYYARIAPVMLPWVRDRPLNLVRCSGSSCWFQRNLNHSPSKPGMFGPAVKRLPILQKNGRTEDYLFIEGNEGIETCLEADVVEFHGWGSEIEDIEKPDRLVIDLDPDEGLAFDAVREAAFQVRDALRKAKLKGFALLSGGKGIHVVVPLIPQAEWPQVRSFAHSFCSALAQLQPDRFTVALPKKERRGRIFLDYLRNQRTATAILPYSARARPGTPVAAPVTWRELSKIEGAGKFTVRDVDRLAKRATSKSLVGWGRAEQLLSAT